jgi:hypothetical protein
MALDALAHESTQLVGRDRVELDRGGAAEFLRPGVGLLRRPRRQVPLLDLCAGDRRSLEVNLGTGRIAPKLGLDVARRVDTGRIEIAEAGLPLAAIAIAALWRKLIEA